MSRVAIVRADYSSMETVFSRIFDQIGHDLLSKASRIAVKINLCDYKPPETGATTHPKFLDNFLEWLHERYGSSRVYVVESDATRARPDLISKWLGIDEIVKRHNATWVNLSKDTWSRKNINGLKFHSMKVPDTIAHSDLLISMAKMKTHSLTTISCSLKNQYGCIMFADKIRFHDFLDEAIVDANLAMTANLAIVDGIIGMGGPKGPVEGVPVRAGLVVAGRDLVAVDSACSRIMGLNPHRIGHLTKASAAGLGAMDFEVCGDGIPAHLPDFETNELYRRILKYATTMRRRSISWG
jgi:uncharacterized protein (DUF362 family)